ncbi:MAG: dihydrofolate reductase [Polyangiales bacterium]
MRSGSRLSARAKRAPALLLACALSSVGCKRPPPSEGRLPPPILKPIDVTQAKADPTFKVRLESFADLRILRYRVAGFEALTLPQKQLLYYLQEAALSGRDITYDQKYEHNLAVRRTLEAVVKGYQGDRTAPNFAALLAYTKRVWFSNGIHHHYSTRKFVPEGLSAADFAGFVRALPPSELPLAQGETVDKLIQKLTPVIFDPKVAPKGVEKDADKDPVRDSANHFYVNLDKDEAQRAIKQIGNREQDKTPPSYGLNSQLVKRDSGAIEERVWKLNGMYGPALAECVKWLQRALLVTETPAQKLALERLIEFYQTGDLRVWDAYSIAWVGDTESKVDLIHGFIETYGDAIDLRATYEALVELEDEVATKRIAALSSNAQWFEDHAPFPDPYRKPNVVGVSARVIQAVVGAGDVAPAMPSGINLPNSLWIREKHGSKSVTLGNIMAAYDSESRDNGLLEEFAASTREIARAKQFGGQATSLMVDLHEVIGHASGQQAPNVGSPNETLKGYAGALEEGRADLLALYFLLDPKLVELRVMPSLEVGRAAYDAYIRSGLITQLARVPLGEQLEEAHMRNRAFITRWVLAQGADEQVIERMERGGKTYYAVRDYVKLRKLFGRLLHEVQRIKSEGDLDAARKLIEDYGVKIDPTLHKEIRARYEVLNVAPYAGFIQPRLTPVTRAESDEIVDVTIEYPDDFTAQQLDYAARYSFLPTYN